MNLAATPMRKMQIISPRGEMTLMDISSCRNNETLIAQCVCSPLLDTWEVTVNPTPDACSFL